MQLFFFCSHNRLLSRGLSSEYWSGAQALSVLWLCRLSHVVPTCTKGGYLCVSQPEGRQQGGLRGPGLEVENFGSAHIRVSRTQLYDCALPRGSRET